MESKLTALLVALASILSCTIATEVSTTAPFVAQLYVPQITNPRQLLLDLAGDVLVSSSGSRITAVRETNHGNGSATVETTLIVDGAGLSLTHGMALHNGFLYASSAATVYRWPYRPGQFSLINQNTRQTVITNITQVVGNHRTRTLTFDDEGRLYISVGSAANVDADSYRSRIRRFNLNLQFLPIPFNNGEIFADGCRNTVGLAWSNSGVLYGVDNGADMLNRPDLGGNIWPENPAEEMNKFNTPIGTHYGYPFCWYVFENCTRSYGIRTAIVACKFNPYRMSTYNLLNYPPRTQFTWPTFLDDGTHTDAWCQNPANNNPPILSMPAHSAPISLTFYDGTNCGVNGGFPCEAINDAFVAFRGSWHQGVGNGYKVTWYPFDNEQELPTGDLVDIIYSPNSTNSCNSCLRATGVIFNRDGHLIVAGDTTHELFRVAYDAELPVITNVYH